MRRSLVLCFVILSVLAPLAVFASGQPDPAAAGTKQVTIEYWVAASGERLRVWAESMKDFEKMHPNIKVDMQQEVGDNTQIQQKIVTQIAAGNAPEVVHIDTMYVRDMAESGRLQAMNDFPGATDVANSFYAAVQSPLMVDGKIYGFPIRANTIELIINRGMYTAKGLDPNKPPKTIDDLRDQAVKLTQRDGAGNIEVFGFGPSFSADSHWTVHAFSPILWSWGGTYVDYQKKKAGWSGEAGINTLNYFNRLINELKVSPAQDITNGFASGRMAMWINGEWQIEGLKRDFPDLDFSFHTIPVVKAGTDPILPLGGRALTVPKGSDNPNEAWELIRWCTSKEEQMRNTKTMVGLTPRKDVLGDPWFNEHPNFKLVQQDMEFVRAKYAPSLLEMDTILFDGVQKTLASGVPADRALAAAAVEYNKILAEKLK